MKVKPLLPSLADYARLMTRCGAWSIARMMYKQDLDITLALRAVRQSPRYIQVNREHKYGWLLR